MIVQVNHVPRLKYGQWLDIRQAGRVGWESEEWGSTTERLGSTAIWANRLIGDRMRTRVVFHLNAKATQLAMGGIYFFEERSCNVLRVSYLDQVPKVLDIVFAMDLWHNIMCLQDEFSGICKNRRVITIFHELPRGL